MCANQLEKFARKQRGTVVPPVIGGIRHDHVISLAGMSHEPTAAVVDVQVKFWILQQGTHDGGIGD